eukprot:SAG25_NODE_307_length_10059_cov_4.956124_8_plen_49_part_00
MYQARRLNKTAVWRRGRGILRVNSPQRILASGVQLATVSPWLHGSRMR